MRKRSRISAVLLFGAAYAALPGIPTAQDLPTYSFNMPAQDLGDALRDVTARAGWELYANAKDVNGVSAQAIHGDLTARDAILRLLQGTGLQAQFSNGVVKIRGRSQAAANSASPDETSDIVVTGTHIRGAPVIAPMVTLTRQDIDDAGQTDLGVTLRTLPQNFNGGQNPGIATGLSNGNANLNSTSSVNLRGLGPDATLTLLNGHRMPTDSANAGVDISAIPVAAVDHIDVVLDGASSLYGSDAVGGVVNVILMRDVDGITTSTRIGTTTDGGDFNQQANIVAGTHWSNGGIYAAYDYAHNDAITAAQRSYTSNMLGQGYLYPSTYRHAVLISGHQDLADNVEFKVDANYDKRWTTTVNASSAAAGVTLYNRYATVETFAATPEFDVKLGKDWQVKAFGSFGRDLTHYDTVYVYPTTSSAFYRGCYCDTAYSAEINADGPLLRLPGGNANVAGGFGWRDNRQDYTNYNVAGLAASYAHGQSSYYAFGEVSLPLIGPDQDIPALRRLVLSAAGRYEDYPGMAKLGTPKVAALYEPDQNISFKVSWGKSFKAPTLYQKYLAYNTYLLSAASYGIGAAGAGILYLTGGNPDLKPETAISLTAGFTFHPVNVPGLKIEASYFDIHYHNRIVEPLTSLSTALSNPAYAPLIDYTPTAATVSQLIAGASTGLLNYSGTTFSAANIAAIADDRYRNVAYQLIRGADFSVSYRADLGNKATLNTLISGTYLDSTQSLSDTLPSTQVAGIIFNSPHWRLHGGTTYRRGDYNLSAFVNYTGSVTDNRYAPAATVAGMTTLDLDGQIPLFRHPDGRPGVLLSVTLNNVLNQKPAVIRTSSQVDTPYDSTNYSPFGRMISVGLSRAW